MNLLNDQKKVGDGETAFLPAQKCIAYTTVH